MKLQNIADKYFNKYKCGMHPLDSRHHGNAGQSHLRPRKIKWHRQFEREREISVHTEASLILRPTKLLTGLDIGYVPAGPHAFLRLSGQFGPPQFIFHWPKGPVFFFFFFSASYAAIIFTGNRQNSEGNVNLYLFFVIYIYRPNVQKCATSRVKS